MKKTYAADLPCRLCLPALHIPFGQSQSSVSRRENTAGCRKAMTLPMQRKGDQTKRPLQKQRPRHGPSFPPTFMRSEEHTSELQSRENLVCRLLLEKKKDYAKQKRQN